MIFSHPIVVLDIETNLITTKKPFPEPLEFAAIKLNTTLDEVDRLHFFVKQETIDPLSLEITNLTSEEILSGEPELDLLPKIAKFCSHCYICSFNLPFDLGVLKAWAARHNFELYMGRYILDLKSLCHFHADDWGMKVKSTSLGGFYSRFFEEKLNKSHRAMEDSETAVKILKYLAENREEQK